jgi:hypothetical protein
VVDLAPAPDGDAEAAVEGANKYLAFAALAALVKYVEHVQHVALAAASVHFTWKAGRGRLALDYETVRNLELLAGARSAIACPSSARRQPGRLQPQLWTPGGSREPRRGRLVPATGPTGRGHGRGLVQADRPRAWSGPGPGRGAPRA